MYIHTFTSIGFQVGTDESSRLLYALLLSMRKGVAHYRPAKEHS